ncbi:hypothetical protein QBC39DRAFT_411112 [Podospora conica]|nr:hypothetical protein QBC39DRAFT_411112 [Schizothecium conicum]
MRHTETPTAMMRVAIAGGGGFAFLLTQQISESSNPVLVLSRQEHPEFEENFPECQVAVVDFSNMQDLRYILQGVDLVISTISGNEQLNLIDAARRARVRRFVPSEFEGDLQHRPANDLLDRGSHAARELLDRLARTTDMNFTVFSCGLFMERFGPGGLQAYALGSSSGVQGPSDYIVDVAAATAEVVETDRRGRAAQVSLTSVYNVVQFVAAAIEQGVDNWPREFRMRGDQMTIRELVATCSNVRGVPFRLVSRTYQDVEGLAEEARRNDDGTAWHYYQRLLQTANGRYHVRQTNLAEAVNQGAATPLRPMRFRAWLEQTWGAAEV